MKKVIVLALLMVFNLGAAASDLIFYEGFESGWPSAWAATVGWSPFFIRDSTDTVVGPVVGFWTTGVPGAEESGIPQVAVLVNGDKVVFIAHAGGLGLGRRVYFEDPDCTGQAYICVRGGGGCVGEGSGYDLARFQGFAYAVGPGDVLYRAAPPFSSGNTYSSLDRHSEDNGLHGCDNVGEDKPLPDAGTWLATPDVDLNTLFTPPYTLE